MITTKLDHLVIATDSLEQGQSYLYDVYGLELSPGGQHPAMGTHNSVLNLDNDSYLELIAIDPNGKTPDMPRWFNLDSEQLQQEIKEKPKLITWVARTNNFEKLKKQAKTDIGTARAMTRGNLSWRFGFSYDGYLFSDGLLPYIIEWATTEHISRAMPDKNYSLEKLELFHPKANTIQEALDSLGFRDSKDRLKISQANSLGLKAYINTPKGLIELS